MTGSLLTAIGARALRSRRLTRAPIWLYRHRLGWMSATASLCSITSAGGHDRGTFCLAVIERPTANTSLVGSGFGPRAEWGQN